MKAQIEVTTLWEFTINTDEKIEVNRPDITRINVS